MAIFALGAGINVDIALVGSGCGMSRAGTPAVKRIDAAVVAVTDTTDRLACVRRGNVVKIGIGGPEATPGTVVGMAVASQIDATSGTGRFVDVTLDKSCQVDETIFRLARQVEIGLPVAIHMTGRRSAVVSRVTGFATGTQGDTIIMRGDVCCRGCVQTGNVQIVVAQGAPVVAADVRAAMAIDTGHIAGATNPVIGYISQVTVIGTGAVTKALG